MLNKNVQNAMDEQIKNEAFLPFSIFPCRVISSPLASLVLPNGCASSMKRISNTPSSLIS